MEKLTVQKTSLFALLIIFFWARGKPPGYRAVSFWARSAYRTNIIPSTAPRKDTLRISLAHVATLSSSSLCSPGSPTNSDCKSGDHSSTALIERSRAGSRAHRNRKVTG